MQTIDFPPNVWAGIFLVAVVALLIALNVTDPRRHRARQRQRDHD